MLAGTQVAERRAPRLAIPRWLALLAVLNVILSLVSLLTGDLLRGAVFGAVGLSGFVVNSRLKRQGSTPLGPTDASPRFAGSGLVRHLLRWTIALGVAAAALVVVPVAVRQDLAPPSLFGWLLPIVGLGLLYLMVKTLALWRVARLLSEVPTGDEHLLAMCSGREEGVLGFLGPGTVIAATSQRVIARSTSVRTSTYASLDYSELDTWQVEGLDGSRPRLTLAGPGVSVSLVALHPDCARCLQRAVQSQSRPSSAAEAT